MHFETFSAFGKYRGYLCALARMQLNGRLQAKLDASDVVQQSLLEAYRDRNAYRGTGERERLAWLRSILANNIQSVLRAFQTQQRDVAREVSLEVSLTRSSDRLERWLGADQESPSQQAMKVEELLQLASYLSELPPAQQDVLLLHYCEGWPLRQIGEYLDRTETAVAALAYRGIRKLRERMRVAEP